MKLMIFTSRLKKIVFVCVKNVRLKNLKLMIFGKDTHDVSLL